MRELELISTLAIKLIMAATKNPIDEFQSPICAFAKEQYQTIILYLKIINSLRIFLISKPVTTNISFR